MPKSAKIMLIFLKSACATPIIMTSMPKFATYRANVEQIILFVKIANRQFEGK